jgi:hypothetical protein
VTPPSVRFLGPKVYLGIIVILVSAMRQGPSPRRVRDLSTRFGADGCTIARWRVFWREHFPQTPFWKIARARLVPVINCVTLPTSLVDAFRRRKGGQLPPLLKKILEDYSATGMPPAYLPKTLPSQNGETS